MSSFANRITQSPQFLAKTGRRLHDFRLDTLQLAKDAPTSWLTSIIPTEKMSA